MNGYAYGNNNPLSYVDPDGKWSIGGAFRAVGNAVGSALTADRGLGVFDLAALGKALKARRDLQFGYLGLQTLYDRYFLHSDGQRIELPQAFFMRVAMGLALNEIDREGRPRREPGQELGRRGVRIVVLVVLFDLLLDRAGDL